MAEHASLSESQARRLALKCQLLDGDAGLPPGREGALNCVERLGYVQIDTVNVIERAHHHTLWTRLPDYRPEYLDALLALDRKIFEYWGHAMCYLPLADFRFYLGKMRSFPDWQSWQAPFVKKHAKLMEEVYARIRAEGPLAARDFGGTAKSKGWWEWKPAKIALDLLFTQGRLMVDRREKFQRFYDLTERVLPDWVDTTLPDEDERELFFTRRAIAAHGVVTLNDIRLHLRRSPKKRKYVDRLVEEGEAVPVRVEGLDAELFALREMLDGMDDAPIEGLHLLSPFDNLVIQRDRVKRLFGFDYALECYKPPSQRVMGYFALPILRGEEFVGRVDAKADRQAKKLLVQGLWWEDGVRVGEELKRALRGKREELAAFNGCGEVVGLP
ncbi:MAG: winged helix DNA-binding domain-containing protein [bacterium]|nr:winged helix DNA-binding domain-containing protein [bacterium]